MANTGWINASNPYVTFRNLDGMIDIGSNSFTASKMGVNYGSAELAIDIDDALISYGKRLDVIINFKCYGNAGIGAKATVRTGYINSGGGYTWTCTHDEEVGRGSSNLTSFSCLISEPERGPDGLYHFLVGARNPILLQRNTVFFSEVSIYINYTPHSCDTNWFSTGRIEPTCTSDGSESFKCSICGATKTDTLPAIGHSFTNYKSDNNATCTADGTKTAKCDRCNVTHTIADAGSAKGHISGTAVTENRVEETCTTDGSYDEVVYCSVCRAELSRTKVTIPARGHSSSCYPEITSIQMFYSNKQISADNKVPVGEYFRIVVGAVAHH